MDPDLRRLLDDARPRAPHRRRVIVLGIGFAFLSSASFDDPNTVWSFAVFLVITSALQTLVYSLVLPIMSAYQTLMYVDQKIRKENFALVLAQASQGRG